MRAHRTHKSRNQTRKHPYSKLRHDKRKAHIYFPFPTEKLVPAPTEGDPDTGGSQRCHQQQRSRSVLPLLAARQLSPPLPPGARRKSPFPQERSSRLKIRRGNWGSPEDRGVGKRKGADPEIDAAGLPGRRETVEEDGRLLLKSSLPTGKKRKRVGFLIKAG